MTATLEVLTWVGRVWSALFLLAVLGVFAVVAYGAWWDRRHRQDVETVRRLHLASVLFEDEPDAATVERIRARVVAEAPRERLRPMTAARLAAPAGQSVAQALAECMGDVQNISKAQRVTEGPARFSFRGVDDVMQAVGPALRKHGVIFAPSRVVSVEHERYLTANNKPMDGVTVVVEYTITGPLGDTMTAAAAGQASDSGDKAVPKAMSVAFRTVLLQALCIPTDEPDPDASVHERGVEQTDPRTEGWRAIEAKGVALGLDSAAIREDYRAKQGHEIDGPESTADTLRDYYRAMGAEPATAAPVAKTGSDADPWATAAPQTEELPLTGGVE